MPQNPITSALIPFLPRQIMLNSKPNIESEKKKSTKKSKTNRKMLLTSIAAFLESSGFEKTLSVFRSEAKIKGDVDDSDVNIEEVVCKFLDSSKGHEEAAVDLPKDLQKNSVPTEDENKNAVGVPEETQKKKRKNKKGKNEGVKPGTDENGFEKDNFEPSKLGDKKDLEKSKSAEDSCVETKEKRRKKKHKMSVGDENTEHDCKKVKEFVEQKIEELKSVIDSSALQVDSNAKHKGVKKKKLKATSESLTENGNEDNEKVPKESDTAKETSSLPVNENKTEKKSDKKRKRLASEEKTVQGENKTIDKQLEGTENNTGTATHQNPDKSIEDEQTPTTKKRKTGNSNEANDQISKKSSKENGSTTQDLLKESGADNLSNGNLEKSVKEGGGTASKSKKKEKASGEPKTVNAFQRVKIEEVKFADDRLQDNSYWALDDTGSGYGAKAQEVLGQVRGRDFRHEKTKKKRGTYRGGQIDYNARSIKFNYDE